ncbi:MAG: serine/threonine-protein phosphatase [Saprospiraceae bacterium]|nr:serine/threonine-protein phosphatase [Saprospiraceae bacterium]
MLLTKLRRRSKTNRNQTLATGIAMTDKGCVRKLNEDAVELIFPGRREALSEKGVLAVLADGMGGHQAGEVASQMAVDIIKDVYYHHPDSPEKSLNRAFSEANDKIFKMSQERDHCKGMGNTCSSIVLIDQKLIFCHVGDSRIYRSQAGKFTQITEDHTLAAELDRAGREVHSQQHHILSRAMGIGTELDFQSGIIRRIKSADRYLICSDGLYDLIDDEELSELISIKTLFLSAQSMIALAKHRGGHDNISVIILEIN